jgi:hypothetical protein
MFFRTVSVALLTAACAGAPRVEPANTAPRVAALSEPLDRAAARWPADLEMVLIFSSDLPPPFPLHREAERIASRLMRASAGRARVRVIDPSDGGESEREAEALGAELMRHQRVARHSMEIRHGYRAVAIRNGEETRSVSVYGADHLEHVVLRELIAAIDSRIRVGVLALAGQSHLETLTRLNACAGIYELVDADPARPLDGELHALLAFPSSRALDEPERANLAAYLDAGGSLAVLGAGRALELEGAPRASFAESGLEPALERRGVRFDASIVHDARCSSVPLQSPSGPAVVVPYPPAVNGSVRGPHPILLRVAQPSMLFAMPIAIDRGARARVLVESSQESWLVSTETVDLRVRNPREWMPPEYGGPYPLVAVSDGPGGRMAIAGSELALDAFMAEDCNLDATQLAIGILDWLALERALGAE